MHYEYVALCTVQCLLKECLFVCSFAACCCFSPDGSVQLMGQNDSSSWELWHGTYCKSRIAHSFLLQGTQLPISEMWVARSVNRATESRKGHPHECGARGKDEQTTQILSWLSHSRWSFLKYWWAEFFLSSFFYHSACKSSACLWTILIHLKKLHSRKTGEHSSLLCIDLWKALMRFRANKYALLLPQTLD